MKFNHRNSRAAKLTPEQIITIRMRYDNEAYCTQGKLSREYGVSVQQIGRIVRGEAWQALPGGAAQGPSDAAIEARMNDDPALMARSKQAMADMIERSKASGEEVKPLSEVDIERLRQRGIKV